MRFTSHSLTKLDYAPLPGRLPGLPLAQAARPRRPRHLRRGRGRLRAAVGQAPADPAAHARSRRRRASTPGAPAGSARRSARRPRPATGAGILVLISDLYEEPARGPRRGGRPQPPRQRPHRLPPPRSRGAASFPFGQPASYEDLESGERHPGRARARRARATEQLVAEHIAGLSRVLGENRIDYALFDTSQPLDHALFGYLSRRQRAGAGAADGIPRPLFLAGLAALAVPVLVHLTHRPRSDDGAVPVADVPAAIPYKSLPAPDAAALAALRAPLRGASCSWRSAFARPFFGVASGAARRRRTGRAGRASSCSTGPTAWRYGDRWPRARGRGAARARRAGRPGPREPSSSSTARRSRAASPPGPRPPPRRARRGAGRASG